ncbi:MAG: hypothetical protein ACRC2T_02525 [Thermoguttaceae bacterium]
MSKLNSLEIFVDSINKIPDPRSKYGTSHPFTAAVAVVFSDFSPIYYTPPIHQKRFARYSIDFFHPKTPHFIPSAETFPTPPSCFAPPFVAKSFRCLKATFVVPVAEQNRWQNRARRVYQTFSWLINHQRNTELLAAVPRFEALRRWHFIIVVRWAATGLDCLLIRQKETKTFFSTFRFSAMKLRLLG